MQKKTPQLGETRIQLQSSHYVDTPGTLTHYETICCIYLMTKHVALHHEAMVGTGLKAESCEV